MFSYTYTRFLLYAHGSQTRGNVNSRVFSASTAHRENREASETNSVHPKSAERIFGVERSS